MGVIFAFCLVERYQWIANPSHEFDAVNHPCKILSKPLLNLYAHKKRTRSSFVGDGLFSPHLQSMVNSRPSGRQTLLE